MFGLTPIKKNDVIRTGDVVDFYDMVDRFFNDRQFPFTNFKNETFKVDVKENENEYLVDAEMAGYAKKDIHINYDDSNLLISVEKKEETEEKNEQYIHRERSFSSMQRAIYLPNIVEGKIKARFENGILKISAQKKAVEATKKEITID